MEGSVEFSEIQYFYKNSTVLLTGATGFVGKLLLEKILRLCHVKHVYVLIRAKDGVDAETRCANIFDSIAFDRLKRTSPEFYKKVSLILGDLEQPDLGLTDYDRQLIIKEVNCIFHCAAVTSLDANLKTAAAVNVTATRDLLDIATQVEDLKTFVYVSTAFSNFPRYEIHEEIYEPKITAERLIHVTEAIDATTIEHLQSTLLGDWPNAYTFTKQVAEDLIKRKGKDLPISIVRASHIIPAVQEPIAGYVENVYSLAGLAAANALGINRVNYYQNGTLDVVPVDYVVSLMVASGWYAGLQKIRKKRGDIASIDVLVYHCISSQEKPITSDEWLGITETVCREVPSSKMIQLPLTFNTACYYNYKLLTFILHTCMAFLCDTGLKLAGKKPMVMEGYEKFHKAQEQGSVYLLSQWYFSNDNTQKLLKRMPFKDRELFNFDILSTNWETYFTGFARGIRVYMMKDPMSTLADGRKRQHRKLITQIFSAAVSVVVLYIIIKVIMFRVFFR